MMNLAELADHGISWTTVEDVTEEPMNTKERKLAARLQKGLKDPSAWREESEQIEVRPSRTAVVSFRLPSNEFHSLHNAATQSRESISEFIRKAIALRISGAPLPPKVEVGCGATRSNFHTSHALAPRAGNPSVPLITGEIERASRGTS